MRIVDVPLDQWLATVTSAREAGWVWFDFLGCVDEIGRAEQFRLVLVLRTAAGEPGRWQTRVPREADETELPASIGAVFAGARWQEREITDLFGLDFAGGDRRPLVLAREAGLTPLRKDAVLGARVAAPWPGAKEPGESDASPSRRRMVPPGVPDPDVWGGRAPGDEMPDAAEIAASAVGGRVRRRRPERRGQEGRRPEGQGQGGRERRGGAP